VAKRSEFTSRAALVGLVVAVTIVGALAWFAVGPGAQAPTGACTTAPASLIESPLAPADPPQIAWTSSALPDGLDDGNEQVMFDVVAFNGGFVAVGRHAEGGHVRAFTLRSTDGLAWEAGSGDDARFARTDIGSLVVAGDRLFAVGSAVTDGRGGVRISVWASDDGRTWRSAAGPFDEAYPSSLATGNDGLLMVGWAARDTQAMAWSSNDGLAWESQPMELPVPGTVAQFGDLAAVADGWMAVGAISAGSDAPSAAVVWRSADGVSWTCHVLDPGGYSHSHAWELHRSGDRWLIIGDAADGCGFGASCAGYSIAWASPDGVSWSEAILQSEPIVIGGTAYDGAAGGFLGVHGGTWLSTDGREWTRVSDGETSGAIGGQVDAMEVTEDGRVIAVGTAFDRNSDAGPWISVGELRIGDE
jgi:hypothetical protein